MMDDKKILDKKRIRKICGTFSWIDHRLITGGFLDDLTNVQILLYLFLVAVSNRYGVSFYHDDRICHMLKIDLSGLGEAREVLIQSSLIAYEYPIYQVLQLPAQPLAPLTPEQLQEQKREKDLFYLNKLKAIVNRR